MAKGALQAVIEFGGCYFLLASGADFQAKFEDLGDVPPGNGAGENEASPRHEIKFLLQFGSDSVGAELIFFN